MHRLRQLLINGTVLSIAIPLPLLAAAPAAPAATTACCDVALDDEGCLRARLLAEDGSSLMCRQVALVSQGETVASGQTDQDGHLVLEGINGGAYQLRTRTSTWNCRAWAVDTAPPAAQPELVIVESELVVRGQGCTTSKVDPARFSFADPIVITALLVAALVVPIVVNNSDDSPAAS